MRFVNHTPFPAQAFEGVDQKHRSFHVVVLRQTLSFADGELAYADKQEPLCEADASLPNGAGWRQESDLCHFKPCCDVIANATAYAPQGRPRTHFIVRLTVRRPDTPAPLPKRPQGLNQFEDAAPEIMARWRAQVQYAEQHRLPGAPLIEKALHISGPRQFKKKTLLIRTVQWVVRIGTIGMLRPTPWKLTQPKTVVTLPLNDGYAFGGACRIDEGDPTAERVHTKDRIPPSASATHPERDNEPARRPVLHKIFHGNPHGAGYADRTYLRAAKVRTVTAPQIERPDATMNARLFWRALQGRLKNATPSEHAAFEPAGFGIRAKSHPSRSKLAGTVDQAFCGGDDALPKDFNFKFWNAAPEDQQTPFLLNDETIELINLCAPGTPGTTLDNNGNTMLRLSLLRHECFALCRLTDGTMFRQALLLDTLMVEPDTSAVTLVWRGTIEKHPALALRACEARMHSHQERDRAPHDCVAIDDVFAAAGASAAAKVGAGR